MKQLLNTLYVTTQGAYLSRERQTLLVRLERETKLRVPIHLLDGVVCFGQVSCSPPLMELCAASDVTISFLSEQGKFLARVVGPVSGNVLLRRAQYRLADQADAVAGVSTSVVAAKMANCRAVLNRAAREDPERAGSEVRAAGARIAELLRELEKPRPVDTVRGYEGEAAQIYFGVFDRLIRANRQDFYFRGRNRRPPMDNVNALLSFIYALLAHDVRSALEAAGLDPAVGFLHRDRPGRHGLALDLMEELRPVVADRLALSLINRRQLNGGGFEKLENGAVRMTEASRKQILEAFHKRKREELEHPFLKERVPIGLLPHIQAALLARHLRGGLDSYPAFFWR